MEGKTKPNAPAFGINRRALLYTAALLPAPALLRITSALAQNADNQLASWNEGAAKQAIIDFVRATTDQASPKFVPPEERIATLDQDVTSSARYCVRRCGPSCRSV